MSQHRSSSWPLPCLILAGALFSSVAHAQPPCPTPPARELFGFNGQAFLIQKLNPDPAQNVDYLDRFIQEYQALGARSIRIGFDWAAFERIRDGFDYDGDLVNPFNYTEIAESFHAAGIEVQGLFNTAPEWATIAPGILNPAYTINMTRAAHFTLVHFYLHGCVTRWEFWNEPQGTMKEPPSNYALWFAAFLEGVQQAEQDLENRGYEVEFEIALGAVDGTDIENWTNNVLAQGSLQPYLSEIDAIAFHPYDKGGSTPEGLNSTVLAGGLAVADAQDWQVWITEYGFNDESGNTQRDKLCYAVSRLSSEPLVTRANLHLLHDIDAGVDCQPRDDHRDPNCYGLINNDFIAGINEEPATYEPADDRKQPSWNLFQRLGQLLATGTPLAADGSDCAPAAPLPISPGPESEIPLPVGESPVTFSWGSSSDPLGSGVTYQWTLYRCDGSGSCSDLKHSSPEQPDLSGQTLVSCGGSFLWEVKARSAEFGVPSTTAQTRFTTVCDPNLPPTDPTGLLPPDDAEVETALDINWDPSTDPDGDSNLVTYVINVIRNGIIVFSQEALPATFVSLNNLTEGSEYTWQVRAKDSRGALSGISQRRFRVRRTPPADQRPDLIPSAIQVDAQSLYAGNPIRFDTTIKNTGATASGSFTVQWWLDGVLRASGVHPGIAAGGSVPAHATSELTWTATEGSHVVEVRVDVGNVIDESDEKDNTATRSILIVPDPRPDLKPTGITFDRLTVVAGAQVFFDSGVANIGASDSGGFTIQWKVDGEDVGAIGGHDGVPAHHTEPNGNSQFAWTAIEGTHRISFEVDVGNWISEPNEGNNRIEKEIVVGTTLPLDLVATALTSSPAAPGVGAPVNFTGKMRNDGGLDSGPFAIRWLVDNQPVRDENHPGLAAGELGTNFFSWFAEPGSHSITFEIDVTNNLAEIREDNNVRSKTVNTGGPAPDVDLQPLAIKVTPSAPRVGDQVVFDSGVLNAGSEDSSSFNVRWLVDGEVVGYGNHPGIPGGSSVPNGNSTFVWTATPGQHTITFIVDADNHVAESNEANNRKPATVTPVAVSRPDLIPTAIVPPTNQLYDGNVVLFDSGVENRGDADSPGFNIRWLVDGVAVADGGHGDVLAGEIDKAGNSQFSWTALPGVHTIGFYVDSGNTVAEHNEGNNLKTLVVTVAGGPPVDLTPSFIRATPSTNLIAGDQVVIDSGVRNLGPGDSGLFNVEWLVDGVSVASGTHQVVPGNTIVNSGNSQFTWTAVAGTHTITFVVDSFNHIAETNEGNNRKPLVLQVAPPPVLGPFTVPAQTNIFAAGAGGSGAVGGGNVPQTITLPVGTGRVLTFAVTGNAVSCCGTGGAHGSDGGTGLSTYISSAGGISGIRHFSRNIFLTGVFLGTSGPGTAPALLQYYEPADTSSPPAGTTSTRLAEYPAPALGQSFFIGDGLAAAGQVQRFRVPDGATRLFLGFADGLNLGHPGMGTPSPATPGLYGDNTGSLSVTITVVR